jgi:multicomponent Na+:H+ antiporter subunit C
MTVVVAVVIGALYGVGVYLLLGRGLVRVLLGLTVLGHGANLLVFTVAGLVRGRPPVVSAGETALAHGAADPVPQALVLTAIVISFAVVAFAAVLIGRTVTEHGSDDGDVIGRGEA